MAFNYSPKIVTDGLVFAVDASNKKSYPGSGTTWSDLVGSNNATLDNGPTYSSSNGGGIVFDGSDDHVDFAENSMSYPNTNSDFTLSMFLKTTNGIVNKVIFQQDNGGGTGRSWLGLAADTDRFYSYLGGSRLELTSITVSDNTIYHVIVKYDSGVLHIGYNGFWAQSSTRSID